jgi:hypothetical protein
MNRPQLHLLFELLATLVAVLALYAWAMAHGGG